MTNRHERELRKTVEEAGLRLAGMEMTGKGHFRLTVRRSDGETMKVVVAGTSSDHRSALNHRALLRRFAREATVAPLPTPTTAPLAPKLAPRPAPPPAPAPAPEPQPPAVEPEPLPAAEPVAQEKPMFPKRTNTRLSHADFYKLCEWLKAADVSGVYSFTEAAKRAAQALNLPVGASSAQSAYEALGLTLATPPSDRTRSGKILTDRSAIVARELAALMRELGKEPSAALIEVATRSSISNG